MVREKRCEQIIIASSSHWERRQSEKACFVCNSRSRKCCWAFCWRVRPSTLELLTGLVLVANVHIFMWHFKIKTAASTHNSVSSIKHEITERECWSHCFRLASKHCQNTHSFLPETTQKGLSVRHKVQKELFLHRSWFQWSWAKERFYLIL